MQFAICNEIFMDWEHDQVCHCIAELGYKGLEIAPFTLAPRIEDLSTRHKATLRSQAESNGVKIIGLHWLLAKTEGFMITSPDPAIRKQTGLYLSRLAAACQELGGDLLVLGSPKQRKIPEGYSHQQAEDFVLDTLSYVLPELERTQVSLCLEPLAPSETDFMMTANDAVRLIHRLEHPLVRLHLDVKAMCSEKYPVSEVIRQNVSWLKHFHANDANGRGPGFGQVDFNPIFETLVDIHYLGWVSLEVFDFNPDPTIIAASSYQHMSQCLLRAQQRGSTPPGP